MKRFFPRFSSAEKLENARRALLEEDWSFVTYHSYNAMLNAAKALVVSQQGKTNTQATIAKEFQRLFEDTELLRLQVSFSELLYQIRTVPASPDFARHYFHSAEQFLQVISNFHLQQNNPTHAKAI